MKTNYSNSVILNNAAVNAYVQNVIANRDLAYDIKKFLMFPLKHILEDLGICRYLIGGTTALIMCYDIPIRKEMKDIDVIVPEGTIRKIRRQIENSPFYSIVSEYKDYKHYNNGENSHIEIKCIQGFNVDIVETSVEHFDYMYCNAPNSEGILYCPLMSILEIKNKWRRFKDLHDLSFIEKWFEAIGIGEVEEQKQSNQEPPETATFERINQMFDNLEEIKRELREDGERVI